jgi:predicted DNA-binding ribbon-helix-helix protein
MKSAVIKRSIVIAGHKTSVSLEDAFWNGLRDIAVARGLNISEMVKSIDTGRQNGNLSSAIRLFVLEHYQNASNDLAKAGTPSMTAESESGAGRGAASALRAE